MSLNANQVTPPLSPQQQDSPLPAALPPDTPGVENPSGPTLSNRAAINSSVEIVDVVNQLPTPIVEHSAPEKSDRSRRASSEAESANADDEFTALLKAAEQGDAESQYQLGDRYFNVDGVEATKELAFKWYGRAAAQGHSEAQFDLGLMYANGVGVQRDEKMSLKWMQMSADQGNSDAQCILGQMYKKGQGVKKDIVKAAELFRKSADQGDSVAQFMLGQMYRVGLGVEKNKVKAVELLRKAAEQDHPPAQHEIALMYQDGKGVKKNQGEAISWFQKSAEQGHAMSQYALAQMYTSGESVEKNNEKAFIWCQSAADQNHRDAMKLLSNFYKEGHGVEKDLMLATYWMMKIFMQLSDKRIFFSEESELFEFIPNILENYVEFKNVKSLQFILLNFNSVENIARIIKIIRSNVKIDSIVFYDLKKPDESSIIALAEALKFNTNLTELDFYRDNSSKETAAQIDLLLTQNKDIAELRQYVKKHPLIFTTDIPVDIIKILDKQIIISYIKSGQTKEATKKAIDEFLMIARTTALAKDSKIT
jgi:TPR repeat protein